jgi:extradiol dioxygenase family protein
VLASFNAVVWHADLVWDDDTGQPGEQFTMFFQDASGNSLEFKVRHEFQEF